MKASLACLYRISSAVCHNQNAFSLLSIENLKANGFPKDEARTISYRDYIEWINLPYTLHREKFFTAKINDFYTINHSQKFENILDYEPLLTACLARALLIDYQLNHYPYYDLNIIHLYSDLPQTIEICRNIMRHWKKSLNDTMFKKINYHIVPLYECKNLSSQILKNIPGNVYIEDKTVLQSSFEIDGSTKTSSSSIAIEDPVYVLMINDIVKNTTHDIVRLQPDGKWSQCYINCDTDGTVSRHFVSNSFANAENGIGIDYWCQFALNLLLDSGRINSPKRPSADIHIPTQMVRLIHSINTKFPDNKILAIDSPRNTTHGFFAGYLKTLLLNTTETYDYLGSKVVESPINSSNRDRSFRVPYTQYMVDFTHLQRVYSEVNRNGSICEVESLSSFVNRWAGALGDTESLELAKNDLKYLNTSKLSVMHYT